MDMNTTKLQTNEETHRLHRTTWIDDNGQRQEPPTIAGDAVKSGGGRFIHQAATAERTVCGKPITGFYSSDPSRVDCYVCQRRSDRRR